MRSAEEIKMDKTITLAQQVAYRINAFPHHGLLKRINYQLVANTEDMYDFILQVENVMDELAEMKELYRPRLPNPDQLQFDFGDGVA
jgi:hypothetical protein